MNSADWYLSLVVAELDLGLEAAELDLGLEAALGFDFCEC